MYIVRNGTISQTQAISPQDQRTAEQKCGFAPREDIGELRFPTFKVSTGCTGVKAEPLAVKAEQKSDC